VRISKKACRNRLLIPINGRHPPSPSIWVHDPLRRFAD
jgi:hypothetical protein